MLNPIMQGLLLFTLCLLLGVVTSLSNSGSRLLVVIEDIAQKSKYSNFLVDLEGKAFLFYNEGPSAIARYHL